MRSLAAVCAALALTSALAACSDDADDPVDAGAPAAHSYDGPLHVEPSHARHPKAGAAGDVVDCDTWGRGGSETARVYAEGATARTPAKALEVARGESLYSGVDDGLLVAKQEEDRVLYVLEVGGVVKQAVIVRNGPATEGAGGDGWYVESWARCDEVELPRSYTDEVGLLVWSDATGTPVPTTSIEARRGPQHCDWQSMVFLTIDRRTWVRRPLREVADHFTDPYRAHATVPADAADTGYARRGKHLWISADGRYAYVGSRDDAEAWPRMVELLGCD